MKEKITTEVGVGVLRAYVGAPRIASLIGASDQPAIKDTRNKKKVIAKNLEEENQKNFNGDT